MSEFRLKFSGELIIEVEERQEDPPLDLGSYFVEQFGWTEQGEEISRISKNDEAILLSGTPSGNTQGILDGRWVACLGRDSGQYSLIDIKDWQATEVHDSSDSVNRTTIQNDRFSFGSRSSNPRSYIHLEALEGARVNLVSRRVASGDLIWSKQLETKIDGVDVQALTFGRNSGDQNQFVVATDFSGRGNSVANAWIQFFDSSTGKQEKGFWLDSVPGLPPNTKAAHNYWGAFGGLLISPAIKPAVTYWIPHDGFQAYQIEPDGANHTHQATAGMFIMVGQNTVAATMIDKYPSGPRGDRKFVAVIDHEEFSRYFQGRTTGAHVSYVHAELIEDNRYSQNHLLAAVSYRHNVSKETIIVVISIDEAGSWYHDFIAVAPTANPQDIATSVTPTISQKEDGSAVVGWKDGSSVYVADVELP